MDDNCLLYYHYKIREKNRAYNEREQHTANSRGCFLFCF